MATPADSDDELYGGDAVDLNLNSNVGDLGGASGPSNRTSVGSSASASESGGVNGGVRRILVDESRIERGLASPTLRGNVSSPWDDAR